MPTSFKLTDKQIAANALLASDAQDILLEGGSRSGKTFIALRAIATRALAVPNSRHAIFRLRFNHIKASIIYDTLPKMMDLCFPGVAEHCRLDKTDWFYRFPNGSEIWFGGLDDKDRTEKVLGQEYATMLFNEISQIPYTSIEIALTRLAQNCGLRLKAYYDCNPPSTAHYSYVIWHKGLDPKTKRPLADKEQYQFIKMNPTDNVENLSPTYLKRLSNMSPTMRKRFLDGGYADATEGALWSIESIEKQRYMDELPSMQRIVVAIDPSGCSGKEGERSDEVGIVVMGLATDGKLYVLEDLSGRFGPSGWAKIAFSAYERWKADRIVAEINYGGAMVEAVIKAENANVPFTAVTATRGKVVRAEPISVLTDDGKLRFGGSFPELEDQLCAMTVSGYTGGASPDRADAMVWGATFLFPSAANDEEDFSDMLPASSGWMS